MEQYRRAWKEAHGYFSLNMVSSRGCPYRCNWCAKPVHGNSYLARPTQAVASEMKYLKEEFQPDHIWFADDIFALSRKWTVAFADAVESLGAQVPFKMQSRCDLMTREMAQTLRRAGCAEVWMGAESGSQQILDAMDKGIRVKDISHAVENLRHHGIRACLFLQFGYPGETWSEIEETIRMVRENRPDDIGVSVSYPLPGTRFFEQVSEQLGSKSNWSDSADLAMMFRGAYSSEFYRALAEAMHTEVRGCSTDNSAAWERVRELEHKTPSPRSANSFPRFGRVSGNRVMKLLLTHAYFLGEDPKERQIMKPYVPLGILYLSSHLRAKGFDVDTFMIRPSAPGKIYSRFWILVCLRVIGIYGNLVTRRNVLEIASRAHANGWKVILGGPEPANYAEEYLAAGADLIVAGEGEYALERLLATDLLPSEWPSIPGIIIRSPDGSAFRTGPAQLVSDLDAQPWPDRERVDIPRYLKAWRDQHGTGSVSLITARGCPYHCNWGSHSVYGKTHRRRSPKSVVDEVAWILER